MVWSSSRDHTVRGGRRFGSRGSADKEVPSGSFGLGRALASRFQRLRTWLGLGLGSGSGLGLGLGLRLGLGLEFELGLG